MEYLMMAAHSVTAHHHWLFASKEQSGQPNHARSGCAARPRDEYNKAASLMHLSFSADIASHRIRDTCRQEGTNGASS